MQFVVCSVLVTCRLITGTVYLHMVIFSQRALTGGGINQQRALISM